MTAPIRAGTSRRGGAATLAALLRSRRFAPLFWCQFFSAFNDNFVRNMLAMLILFRLGENEAGAMITLAIGVFMLPSLLLSGLGGEMADSWDKARLARRLKGAEILVQSIAAIGLWLASAPLLFAALFGLGVVNALFGPLKYAILPDLLESDELVAGNALVEAATFAAIFLGLIAGGLSAARAPEGVMAQLMLIALICWAFSLFIPATGRADQELRLNANVLASTGALLREIARDNQLLRRATSVSWFWMAGAVALSLTPVVLRDKTGAGIAVETAVSAIFAIGVGIGSIAAALLANGLILLRPVPLAAVGMGLFLIDLGVSTAPLPTAHGEIGLGAFFTSITGLRAGFDVLGLACAGGLFVVPLFTAIQADAPPARRARIIGGVNVLNSLFMVVGVAATALLQSKLVGLSEFGAARRAGRPDARLRRLRSSGRGAKRSGVTMIPPDPSTPARRSAMVQAEPSIGRKTQRSTVRRQGVLRRNSPNARGPSPTGIRAVTFSVCASIAKTSLENQLTT